MSPWSHWPTGLASAVWACIGRHSWAGGARQWSGEASVWWRAATQTKTTSPASAKRWLSWRLVACRAEARAERVQHWGSESVGSHSAWWCPCMAIANSRRCDAFEATDGSYLIAPPRVACEPYAPRSQHWQWQDADHAQGTRQLLSWCKSQDRHCAKGHCHVEFLFLIVGVAVVLARLCLPTDPKCREAFVWQPGLAQPAVQTVAVGNSYVVCRSWPAGPYLAAGNQGLAPATSAWLLGDEACFLQRQGAAKLCPEVPLPNWAAFNFWSVVLAPARSSQVHSSRYVGIK